MICPFCASKTKIYNSRSTHLATQTWRRLRCTQCKRTFTTKEKIDWSGTVKVTSANESALYTKDRLLLSISRAAQQLAIPPSAIIELTDSIELELQNTGFFEANAQDADLITSTAIVTLGRFNTHMALQYANNVYRNQPPLELIKQFIP